MLQPLIWFFGGVKKIVHHIYLRWLYFQMVMHSVARIITEKPVVIAYGVRGC